MTYRQCNLCEQTATHHSVEIVEGERIQKHLCDVCAAEHGLAFKVKATPINELLANFVKMHESTKGDTESDQDLDEDPDYPNEDDEFNEIDTVLGLLCDLCDKSATHHIIEVIDGQKIENRYCDQCAPKPDER